MRSEPAGSACHRRKPRWLCWNMSDLRSRVPRPHPSVGTLCRELRRFKSAPKNVGGVCLLELSGLRCHSQPLALALHKNISPHIMAGGSLAVYCGGLLVGPGNHGSEAEDADLHVAQRGRLYVAGLDLSGSLGLGLALAV